MERATMPKSYMQEVDDWIEEDIIGQIIADDGDKSRAVVHKAIREKLLESYRNGQKAVGKEKKGKPWQRR
jgi:hypothetical protein